MRLPVADQVEAQADALGLLERALEQHVLAIDVVECGVVAEAVVGTGGRHAVEAAVEQIEAAVQRQLWGQRPVRTVKAIAELDAVAAIGIGVDRDVVRRVLIDRQVVLDAVIKHRGISRCADFVVIALDVTDAQIAIAESEREAAAQQGVGALAELARVVAEEAEDRHRPAVGEAIDFQLHRQFVLGSRRRAGHQRQRGGNHSQSACAPWLTGGWPVHQLNSVSKLPSS